MNALVVRNWARVGVGSGLVACPTCPLLGLVPMPRFPTATVDVAFGPSLGLARVGLYLLVVILVWRSRGWVDARLAEHVPDAR